MKPIKMQNYLGNFLIFGIIFSMTIFSILIIKSNGYRVKPDLMSFGVTFDLLFSIPVLYFLLIRKTKISKNSISILLTLNVILATIFIPQQNQFYLNFFKKWFLPLFELAIIAMLIFKVRKTIREVNEVKNGNLDFFNVLKKVVENIIPKKLAIPLSTEIAVFYYGFLNWKKPILKKNQFSYYKRNGIITTLIAFLFCGIIEIFVVHKILLKWNQTLAMVISVLSIYTAIQVFGILRALSKRPITIEKDGIYLKYSIISETFIDFKNIKNICNYKTQIEKNGSIKYFSPFGKLEGNNVKIDLINEQTVEGFYGFKREIKIFVLFIDNENDFIKQVETFLPNK